MLKHEVRAELHSLGRTDDLNMHAIVENESFQF